MSGTNGDYPPLTNRPCKLLKRLILKSLIGDSLGTIANSLGVQNTPKLTGFCTKFHIGPFRNSWIALNGRVNNPLQKRDE